MLRKTNSEQQEKLRKYVDKQYEYYQFYSSTREFYENVIKKAIKNYEFEIVYLALNKIINGGLMGRNGTNAEFDCYLANANYINSYLGAVCNEFLPVAQLKIKKMINQKNTDRNNLLKELESLHLLQSGLTVYLQRWAYHSLILRPCLDPHCDNEKILSDYIAEIKTSSATLEKIDRKLNEFVNAFQNWKVRNAGFKTFSEQQKQIEMKLKEFRATYSALNTKYTLNVTPIQIAKLDEELAKFAQSELMMMLEEVNEKGMFKRWSGICRFIIENLAEIDVNDRKLLANVKLDLSKAIQNESYAELVNLIAMIKDIVITLVLKEWLNTLVIQIQALKNPDQEIIQCLTEYFDIHNKLVNIKTNFNQLKTECNSWQAQYWAPLTDLQIRNELDKMLKEYNRLEKICLGSDIKEIAKIEKALEDLGKEVNDFSVGNKQFNQLRQFVQVHKASPYSHYSVTDLSVRVDTYVNNPQISTPEMTYDILRNYFYNEIKQAYELENSFLVDRIETLLAKIKASKSLEDSLLALYEYLTEQHEGFAGIHQKVEKAILRVLDLPISITGFTEKVSRFSSTETAIKQLSQRLANVEHEIKLGDAQIKLTIDKDTELFTQWKAFTTKLGEMLADADLPLFNRFFSNSSTSLRKEISTTKNLFELFNVLLKIKSICANENLNDKLQYAIENIYQAKLPTQEAFNSLLSAKEAYEDTLKELMETLSNLKAEFDSWNGSLWVKQQDGALLTCDNDLHPTIGLKIQAQISEFEKRIQAIVNKKLTSPTQQGVNDIHTLRCDIYTLTTSNDDFLTLRAAHHAKKANEEMDEKAKFIERKNKLTEHITPLQQTIIRMKKMKLANELINMFEVIKKEACSLVSNFDDNVNKMHYLLTELEFIELMQNALDNPAVDANFKNLLLHFLRTLADVSRSGLTQKGLLELNEIKAKAKNLISLGQYDTFAKNLTTDLTFLQLRTLTAIESPIPIKLTLHGKSKAKTKTDASTAPAVRKALPS